MYKYSILFVATILCSVKCLPLDATHSETSSTNQLHLVVQNTTQSTNYHLLPDRHTVMNELENVDQQIDNQLKAILPYLNFFFDTLLGEPKAAEEDDCINDMVIELVPDENAKPSKGKSDKIPADKPEPEPEPESETEPENEPETEPEPVSKPDVVPAPKKPVNSKILN